MYNEQDLDFIIDQNPDNLVSILPCIDINYNNGYYYNPNLTAILQTRVNRNFYNYESNFQVNKSMCNCVSNS